MTKTLSPLPQSGDMISSRVEAVPNGQHYGKDGHIPCDHIAIFEYPDCTRTFDKNGTWTVTPKS